MAVGIGLLLFVVIFILPIFAFYFSIYRGTESIKQSILIMILEYIGYIAGSFVIQIWLPGDWGDFVIVIGYYVVTLILIVVVNLLVFKKKTLIK